MRLLPLLLVVLALVASPAHAGFVVGAALAAGVSALGASLAGATVGAIVTRAAITFGVSLLAQAFAPEPRRPEERRQGITTKQTTTGGTTPLKFVVGRTGLEGHLVAPPYSRGEKNRILTYILEVSNIPVQGLTGRVIVDGEYTDIIDEEPQGGNGRDATGASRLGRYRTSSGFDKAWLWFEDGSQTAAHPHLVDKYGSHPERPWTTNHKLLGSAYAVVEFMFDREVFQGLPRVRFEVDGISLYDPRRDSSVGGSGSHRFDDTSTWEFTKNPQVINYNVLRGITLPTGDVYGGGYSAEDLPLDNWFAAMNECDVDIGGRTQFEAGIEVDTNEMEPLELIEEMNKASLAEMSITAGVARVRVGAPSSPVMTLTDGDFVITEPSEKNLFPGLRSTRNAIDATYSSPVDLWEDRSADPITNAAWEAEDGDRRLWASVDLRAVSNNSQVQQVMQGMINDDRRFRTHRMTLPPSFARLEPLDTMAWDSDSNGYVDKLFEVVEVDDRPDTIQQSVLIREREQGDVAWSPSDDVPVPLARNGYVPPSQPVPVLVIPADTIVSTTRVIREALQNVIVFDVTFGFPDEVNRVEVQFQSEADDAAGEGWTALSTGTLGKFELVAPDVGKYRFRARTFGENGEPGGWTTTSFVQTATLSDTPGGVADFFGEVVDGTLTLEWEPVPDGDLSYFLIRHASETTGATWANATTAVPKVSRPATSVSLPARSGTYMIKSVSKTGVPSKDSFPLVVLPEDIKPFTKVITDDEHPAFSGTKTNLEVVSGELRITDSSSAPSSGTYDFTGFTETHDSTIRRVRARVDTETFRLDEGAGNWDGISGTFDEFPGNFDSWTGAMQFADTDVHFFISTTDDDPAGTPTWRGWRRLRAGDFRGRAFRFRSKLVSSSDGVTPSIKLMRSVVEYDA